MCLMCEGWSDAAVNALLDDRIRAVGWTTISVGDEPARQTWTYTLGLAVHGHPELVVAGVTAGRATEALDDLADRVVDGERLGSVDEVAYLDGWTARVRDVHPVHVERGLVGGGQRYYEWLGLPMPTLRVRQIVLPDSEFCRCHAGSQPRLHLPHVSFASGGPKRAERRRAARRRPGPRP